MDFVSTPPRNSRPKVEKSLKRPSSEQQIKILARIIAENQPSITEGKLVGLFSAETGVGIATFNKLRPLLLQLYPNISQKKREREFYYDKHNTNNNNNNNLEKKKIIENNYSLSLYNREFSLSESISHDKSDNLEVKS
tara:strand:- start:287 stop:700 length:414 start_codon:yes stop_codon:yes gene_type:complete